MLFNSFQFAIFFPIVFFVYWIFFNKTKNIQNVFLLIVSYYFYSQWDYRFLFLLFSSTFIDFISGILISRLENNLKRKILFYFSICLNIGILFFFKYCNFFVGSIEKAINLFGFKFDLWSLHIIIPVGISFYTFHGISYVIDVYKRKIKPEKSFVVYSLFVSYFPLLVAGPIERASHLIPQLRNKRKFNYANTVLGLRQVLWGLFKKMVVADSVAIYVNQIFLNYENCDSSVLILGAFLFTFQIYGDFSGYSDIALGISRMLGIDLIKNFNFPYFSRDIAEFWRRWHISLSSWFRDYLYIPLGGSKGSKSQRIRNTLIIFLISGFWHGANWTFIVWGLLHALYFIPVLLTNKNRNHLNIVAAGKKTPSIGDFFAIILTFSMVVFAWVFFRSVNVYQAFNYISIIFTKKLFVFPETYFNSKLLIDLLLILFLVIVEWFGRENDFALQKFHIKINKFLRFIFYYIILYLILFYCSVKEQKFIYFDF